MAAMLKIFIDGNQDGRRLKVRAWMSRSSQFSQSALWFAFNPKCVLFLGKSNEGSKLAVIPQLLRIIGSTAVRVAFA